jgi:serine/threonine protein kinase/tetratricopeptide (TPR) repeat protein
MTADEWEEIKTLFEAALHLPAEERSQYVARVCGDRSTILRTVLDLLENHINTSNVASTGRNVGGQLLEPGELIGERFRVVRFIAAGGMGEVYEVYDELLRVRLALKALRFALLHEPGAIDRFQRELLTARGVAHPNLCKVFDLVEHRRANATGEAVLPCLTMELLEGESLADYVERHRPISPGVALPWIREIAAALDALHSEGLVHRDLKPSNVMLARKRGGELAAVVMDFGLAKAIDHDSELFESKIAWNAGSPYFMAPELLREGRASVSSDIYAFGLLIDEMVTGTRAFPARSLAELYYCKLWEKPIGPRERAEDLPDSWAIAIERCLESDCGRRHTRATDVVKAIESGEIEPAPSITTEGIQMSRRRWLRRGALAIPAIVGVAAIRIVLSRVQSSVDLFDIENDTRQPGLDYYASGTTQEILRRLQGMTSVRVIPVRMGKAGDRTGTVSASQFQLRGRLQDAGNIVKLRMDLSEGGTGNVIWTHTYEEELMRNPVVFQAEIAQGVVTALENKILYAQEKDGANSWIPGVARPIRQLFGMQLTAELGNTPTRDNQALDDYMRGSKLLEEVSGTSTQIAIEYFEKAVAKDPGFGLAHAALAQGHLANLAYAHGFEKEALRKAQESAERAVQLTPDLAEAFAALGAVRQAQMDWRGAEESYVASLRLKPNFARVHRWYAGLVLQFARSEEAIAHSKLAFDLDPYDRATPTSYGLYLFLAGRYRDAIAILEPAVDGREVPGTRFNLGQVYARLGYLSQGPEAEAAFRKALGEAETLEVIARRETARLGKPVASFANLLYALTFSLSGDPAASDYESKLKIEVSQGMTRPVVMAWIASIQGRREEALQCLEDVWSRREQGLNYLRVNPFLENLRGTPRFQALLQQLRLI